MKMPEAVCPYCEQELEIAEMRNPPGLSHSLSGWFYFKDGSHVVGAKEAMPPRKCYRCHRQWLHHLSTDRVLVIGF